MRLFLTSQFLLLAGKGGKDYGKDKKLTGRKRDERITAYMFVAPAVILLIAFLVVPMIYTVYFSGFKYQIMRPDAIKFIGLENYQKLFSDKNFWIALKNTVYFTVLVVPIQCALALGLALLVSKNSGAYPFSEQCISVLSLLPWL